MCDSSDWRGPTLLLCLSSLTLEFDLSTQAVVRQPVGMEVRSTKRSCGKRQTRFWEYRRQSGTYRPGPDKRRNRQVILAPVLEVGNAQICLARRNPQGKTKKRPSVRTPFSLCRSGALPMKAEPVIVSEA